MSDLLDRGITVSEISAMDQPIDVNTETIAAFVGRTLRGPLNTPVLITNTGEFRRRFGDAEWEEGIGPAVCDFFDHGGRQLYAVRVANNARGAMICLPAAGSALVLRALEPGSREVLRAAVDYDTVASPEQFNLTLQRIDGVSGLVIDQEYFRQVSYLQDEPGFVGDALDASRMARVECPLPTSRPEATVGLDVRIGVEYVGATQAGSDGAALSDYDIVGSRTERTGIFALDGVERLDILYLPPFGRTVDIGPASVLAAEQYSRERGAVLVTDPRADWEDAEAAVLGVRKYGYASPNMLGYFPRVVDSHDADKRPRAIGGAIAGLLAKHDRKHGPWTSFDQQCLWLRRRYQPGVDIDVVDQRLLGRAGLNRLIVDSTRRLRLAGDRTLAHGSEPHFRCSHLPVRRLCLGVVHAIDAATRWAVFEQPGPRLALKVKAQVVDCLAQLHDLGALADADFYVSCQAESSAPLSRQRIELLLSFTPTGCPRPVSLTLHQSAAGCGVGTSAFAPAEDGGDLYVGPARPAIA